MNSRQQQIIALLRAREDRDLYETGAPPNGKHGSGFYAVTYTGDELRYEYLTTAEVEEMERQNLIEPRWPGCFKLKGSPRRDRKGNPIQ